MFDFFEGLIEKLGVKLVSNFTKKLIDFINDVKNTDNDDSENRAQIGSSGYGAKIDISGSNSIGFACGCKSIIKAKKGTWISLAEYGKK